MPASPADSALYRGLFSDDETVALFTDSAEIRAMLLVEGTLARVQGQLGLIPETAAAFIDRSAREVQIDPAALADPEMAEDLIAAAFNDAVNKINAASQEKMAAATAGMPLPPGMKLPF